VFALALAAGAIASVASCVGTPAIASQTDPAAPFARYRTFALLPVREPLNPRVTPEVLRTVDDSVREVFGARGLQVTEVNAADLLVRVHGGPREIVEPAEDGFSYGRFRPWGFGGGPYELSAPRAGLVLIDVFDARTRELVWRGTAAASAEPGPLHASVRAAAERYPQ
jgi:hypothetical protein